MKRRPRAALEAAVLLAALTFAVPLRLGGQAPRSSAQVDPPTPAGPAARAATELRVDVDLVLVNVTVTDSYNRLVTGLTKDNFEVYEDDQAQKVLYFSNEDAPISLGVVFDASSSMDTAGKLDRAIKAAVEFLRTANPQDEFFVVEFNDRPKLLTGFTSHVEEVQNQMVFVKADGRTALLDAIYLALNKMREASNPRKALLVISDGGDNHSRYSQRDVTNFVRESDVQIYAIGIFDTLSNSSQPELIWGPSLLSDLAEVTGGRMFPVEVYNVNQLPDIAAKISLELRNQYVLGYRPSNKERDGTWRKIKVKLDPPKGLPPLTSYARSGYYAPSQ